jgi:hypothetical protein
MNEACPGKSGPKTIRARIARAARHYLDLLRAGFKWAGHNIREEEST